MPKTYTAPQSFSETEYVPIPMTPVESRQIAAVGYSPERKRLEVRFTRGAGAIYQYLDVEPELHADFMAAESKGTFFGVRIKSLPFDKFPAPKPVEA